MGVNVKVKVKAKEGVPSPKSEKEALGFLVKEKETEQGKHQSESADDEIQHVEPANVIGRTEKQIGDETPAKLLPEKILHEDAVDEIACTGEDPQKRHDVKLRVLQRLFHGPVTEYRAQASANDEEGGWEFDEDGKPAEEPDKNGKEPF